MQDAKPIFEILALLLIVLLLFMVPPVVLLGPAPDGTTPEPLPELPTREDGPGALVALVNSVLAEWLATD